MTLSEILSSEIFKNATLNLGFRSHDMEWDAGELMACATALKEVSANAAHLADQTEQGLMEVIDKVMRKFYPRHARWDDPRLLEFLNHNATMIESVAQDNLVASADMVKLFQFCEEMWIELVSYERRMARQN